MQITEWMMVLLQVLMLVTAVSIDAFCAGFAYGISKVHMPFLSVGIVSAVSAVLLFVSIGAGGLLGGYLPGHLAARIGCGILFFLGVFKLFDRSGKREAQGADKDDDHILSPREAVALGIALSLDSVAAGIGVSVDAGQMLWAAPAALIINFGVMRLGGRMGKLLAGRVSANLDWISGVLLILLAALRMR